MSFPVVSHLKLPSSRQTRRFYIQPTLQTMRMLSETCESVSRLGATGGRTLSLLHQQLQSCQSGNASSRAVAEHLCRAAAGPYFETLSRWIHRGIIHDPGRDFFVQDHEETGRAQMPLEYSDDYWERRYSIKPDQIPSFLHNHSDMILRTGTEGTFS